MNEGKSLEAALRLRQAGELEASRMMILSLHAEAPDNPTFNYQCAWAHDCLGLEREAVPYYERALAQGLAGEDREGALLEQ